MSQNAAFDDANIPVLTEVVQDKVAATPADIAAVAEVQAPAGVESPAEVEAPAPAALPEPDWSALEHSITERTMEQLQAPVGLLLDQALAGLADQLRAGLQQSIKAAVVQAVAQEMAQLRTRP